MSARKVVFKLNAEEAKAALSFANQIGMPLDFIAKQSLFMSIQQAYARAAEMQKNGNATTGNASGHPLQAEGVPSSSTALADTGSVASDVVG